MTPPFVLIIGRDGMLGSRLMAHLTGLGIRTIGTSRRHQTDGSKALFLDLDNPTEWHLPDGITHAALFAAVCDRNTCERNPEETTRINVDNTMALASRLAAMGVHLLFPSTDKVFDGNRPDRPSDDPICPIEEYGHQKSLAEAALQQLGNTAIFRMSKIVGPNLALLENWSRDLLAGRPIHPFINAVQSPVSLDLAIEAMTRLMLGKCSGIFQLSADRDVTFAEIATDLARLLKVNPDLVQPVPATVQFHRHSTLDGSTLHAATGLSRPEPIAAIEAFVTSRRQAQPVA